MTFYLKKLSFFLLAAAMSLCLFGCSTPSMPEAEKSAGHMWRIGVCHSDSSEYGDIIMEGFSQAMANELPEDSVTFTREYISNEKSGAAIASDFVDADSDLILTVGTPALKGAAITTQDIPIITTDVIDIQSAVNITDLNWNMRTGRNITGITGMPNIADQLALILEVTPGIKTLAIVYGKNDLYSIEQSRIMQEYLSEAGIEAVMYQLTDISKKKITAICNNCDAIFIPAGCTMGDDIRRITRVASEKNIPTIGGDVNIGKNTLVCLCPDYYSIGYNAGKQAAQILGHGKNPGKISVEFFTATGIKLYNRSFAKKMGLTFPKSFHLYDQEALNNVFSDR
ncbi:MAG: ABC transporter substrate-binding protein [Lachnospiraceae bacterium]|nr:ABC transporter substrate-binding protein [Lachnospiraceae bacterium]